MFRNLLSRLFADDLDPRPLATQDAEIAVAALLVRVARSDNRYHDSEKQRIDQVLSARNGISLREAAERRGAAEMIEAEAPDTVRFTRHIKERVALDDRLGIISALWEVTYADDSRSADEETLVRLISGLLGITDRDSALARQQVLDNLGLASNG